MGLYTTVEELAQLTSQIVEAADPSDDQSPVSAEEALKFAEAADVVYRWAMQVVE